MISFENDEVKGKFDELIKKPYFKYNFGIIVDTFQNFKVLNILQDEKTYKVYIEKESKIIQIEIDLYNCLHIDYIAADNDNEVVELKENDNHSCEIMFRINDIVYQIKIYNYLDDIIVDNVIAILQDKNIRMENIRDIYNAITDVVDAKHSSIIIRSMDNTNLINAHHGTILNYKEIVDMIDYKEERYLKDGKYYIERKYLKEQEEMPFVKIKKNGE